MFQSDPKWSLIVHCRGNVSENSDHENNSDSPEGKRHVLLTHEVERALKDLRTSRNAGERDSGSRAQLTETSTCMHPISVHLRQFFKNVVVLVLYNLFHSIADGTLRKVDFDSVPNTRDVNEVATVL